MVSYRFCRPDDAPLLLNVINHCWDAHFEGAPLDVRGYKREVHELQLWASSSMIALEGDDPVAVVVGSKRVDSTWISRVGVHPDCLRRGHASHLINSLLRKMAILGPAHVCAEIPVTHQIAEALFSAQGFEPVAPVLKDLVWRGSPQPARAGPHVSVLEWRDVCDHALLEVAKPCAWSSARQVLDAIADDLTVWALVSDRLEAVAVFRDFEGVRQLKVLAWEQDRSGLAAATILLIDVCATSDGVVEAIKWNEGVATGLLQTQGFITRGEHQIWQIFTTNEM